MRVGQESFLPLTFQSIQFINGTEADSFSFKQESFSSLTFESIYFIVDTASFPFMALDWGHFSH